MRHWVHFNARQWPLVVFETPVRFSSLQLERYFDDFEFCLARREPFVAILDLSASFLPTPEVRRDLLSFRRRTGTGAALLGEAIVAPSRPMAAWAAPLADGFDQEDARTEFFQTRADAIAWSRQQLAEAGHSLAAPPLRKSGMRAHPDAVTPTVIRRIG